MSQFIKLIKTAKRKIIKNFNLFRLKQSKNPTLYLIYECILETSFSQLEPLEKQLIGNIEQIRNKLESSQEQITRIDFGARNSFSNSSLEEMEEGLKVTNQISEICKVASKSNFWSLFLFKVIRKFKPVSCIEMGTAFGISAAYQSTALKLNKKGRLITLEGDDSLAQIASTNFINLELENVDVKIGRFKDTLLETLNISKPIDYVFIDGHHDEKATIDYFEKIYPFLSKKAVVIFDDIVWSDGMKRAWEVIQNDIKINFSFDLGTIGLCLIDNESILTKKHYMIPL